MPLLQNHGRLGLLWIVTSSLVHRSHRLDLRAARGIYLAHQLNLVGVLNRTIFDFQTREGGAFQFLLTFHSLCILGGDLNFLQALKMNLNSVISSSVALRQIMNLLI